MTSCGSSDVWLCSSAFKIIRPLLSKQLAGRNASAGHTPVQTRIPSYFGLNCEFSAEPRKLSEFGRPEVAVTWNSLSGFWGDGSPCNTRAPVPRTDPVRSLDLDGVEGNNKEIAR